MERRLAAILAADVTGYSRLMAADEAGTLARLQQLRAEVIEPRIGQFHGRIVGSAGDSLLIEFASAVNAVECAVQMQESLAQRNIQLPEDQRMAFRMGVNLGDVIAEGGTIHGNGVNIAARLEKLADPGGICIGRSIYDQVKGKLAYQYNDLGALRVHNIPDPVEAYRVRLSDSVAAARPTLALPEKPSIAVLPFQNMSGDPAQEYFVDGLVEEIITALSRMRWLFVIARNSSFIYKERVADVKQVGRELGVRYVLEGSIRKSANRVRITGQLIDSSTGTHLWADRFEGRLEDIFDLQDQMTVSVVGAIAPKLEQAEIARSRSKPTSSLDAYDYYLRGLAAVHQWTREANNEALSHFYRAIELDPAFASAYGLAARCYSQRKTSGWMINHAQEIADAARLARRAVELGRDDAVALCAAGFALANVVGEVEHGAALIDRALLLNPNLAWAWYFSSWVNIWLGKPQVAIERAAHALRLSPNDSHMFIMQTAIAYAHFMLGRYIEAASWAEMALGEKPDYFLAICLVAASRAITGQLTEAEEVMTRLREIEPALRISNFHQRNSIGLSEDFARFAEGLRKAGLPE